MVCRGPDGSLISADSVVELNEYSQERVPEDEVPFVSLWNEFFDHLLPRASLYFLIPADKHLYLNYIDFFPTIFTAIVLLV